MTLKVRATTEATEAPYSSMIFDFSPDIGYAFFYYYHFYRLVFDEHLAVIDKSCII